MMEVTQECQSLLQQDGQVTAFALLNLITIPLFEFFMDSAAVLGGCESSFCEKLLYKNPFRRKFCIS